MTTPAEASPSPPAVRRNRWPRIIGGGLLLVLLAAGALALFPPAWLLTPQLQSIVASKTGRQLTVAGHARYAFRPDLVIRLEEVSLANPPGFTGPALFSAKAIDARVKLLPLLRGRVEIVSLDLDAPQARLERNAAGAVNWDFRTSSADAGASSGRLPIGRVMLADGRLTYIGSAGAAPVSVDKISGQITGETETGALEAKGELTYRGDAMAFDIQLGDARQLAAGKPSPLEVSLDARTLKATFAGEARGGGVAGLSGALDASSPSARDLARWLGATFDTAAAPMILKGTVDASGSGVGFTTAKLVVGETTSTWDGKLDLSGARPKLKASVTAPRVDLGALTGRAALAPAASAAEAAGPDLVIEPGWQDLVQGLERIEGGANIAGAAPAAEAALAATAAHSPWSNDPLNLAALKVIDAEVDFAAADMPYGTLGMRNARLATRLTDGRLSVKVESIEVAQGKATGSIDLDTSAAAPAAAVDLHLANVAAAPVLTEIAGKPLLEGASNVDIKAKAKGQSLRQLVSSLEGDAKFTIGRGAIKGFDVRRVVFEWWRKWTFNPAVKTGFDRLAATYDIKKGVIRSAPELTVSGSEVAIRSKGSVTVPTQLIDQKVRLEISPPPLHIPIPVKVSGNWSKPVIKVDIFGMFAAPQEHGLTADIAPHSSDVPAEVRQAIEQALASPSTADRLPEASRDFLRALVAQ